MFAKLHQPEAKGAAAGLRCTPVCRGKRRRASPPVPHRASGLSTSRLEAILRHSEARRGFWGIEVVLLPGGRAPLLRAMQTTSSSPPQT